MSLHDDVRAYYWQHFNELSTERQFHFTGRLAMWNHEEHALAVLSDMRSLIVPSPLTTEALMEELSQQLNEPPRVAMPAYNRRKPYFERYPHLYGWHQALFRVRHLEVLYDVPSRHVLMELVEPNQMLQLADDLWQDDDALRTLSTLAVNYLYLFQRYVTGSPEEIDVAKLYELGSAYNLDNPEEVTLLIYLYTHCIIAASDFYVTALPSKHIGIYITMLEFLESVISTRFGTINLDTKLEFLVCCKIAGFTSNLEKRIYEECEQSVSPNGTFLIDTVNDTAGHNLKHTFGDSEHRNVLFILSNSTFRPLQLKA